MLYAAACAIVGWGILMIGAALLGLIVGDPDRREFNENP